MQEYCLEEQQQGADALERRSILTVTAPKINRECARKWPDDFAMRDYCERTYVETPWWHPRTAMNRNRQRAHSTKL